MKNSNGTIGNRTRDLPDNQAVPQQSRGPEDLEKKIISFPFWQSNTDLRMPSP
jgi:hypothetical protein